MVFLDDFYGWPLWMAFMAPLWDGHYGWPFGLCGWPLWTALMYDFYGWPLWDGFYGWPSWKVFMDGLYGMLL